MRRLLLFSPLFALALSAQDGSEARAVLNTCLGCHNSKTAMSGLSLDTREGILKGGKHGPAVKPGEGALLLEVVRQTGAIKMPPGGKLKDAQIAVLEKWVADGMPMAAKLSAAPVHWSFQPPKKAAVPDGEHPVDFFVRRKLTEAGLAMSKPADRRTLLRRVSLDRERTPAEWLLMHDVRHARSNLDFSRWSLDPVREPTPQQRFQWMCRDVRRGIMPPRRYLITHPITHPSARLTGDETTFLCAWARQRAVSPLGRGADEADSGQR